MNQSVAFGDNSQKFLKDLFSLYCWKRCFLVTGKDSYQRSGAKDFIENAISNFPRLIYRFSNFETNPNVRDLRVGLNIIREYKPDVIIAIGGGSVIDMGKLLRFFYTHHGDFFSGFYESTGTDLPLIAIPTTSGTGSEATHFAVLYDESKTKHSIAATDVFPEYAIVNSSLTYNQNSYLTACSGFDALAQAIEAYWNRNATLESDKYAHKAISIIYSTLPLVVTNPTPDLRDKMSEGAYWAGRAIDITKTTAPHAFSYPFTAHYGIPHGHAVAIVFPTIAEFNIKNGNIPKDKVKYLYDLFGSEHIFKAIERYVTAIGLSIPNKDYSADILLKGISLDRLANNPAEINNVHAVEILNKVLYSSNVI